MTNEITEFEGSAFEEIAGPPEELDKLMGVNWNRISMADAGSDTPVCYYKATRETPSKIRLDYVFDLYPDSDPNDD